MNRIAHAHRWAERAVAEAVHRLKMDALVGGGLSESDAKRARSVRREGSRAYRLACFRLTELHDRTSNRRLAKVTVECNDAMYFGAREVERVRRVTDGGGRHVAEPMLHAMQERQQLVGVGREVGDEFVENGELVTNLKRMV